MKCLMVAMHAQTHRIMFDNEAQANDEFARFSERLAEGRWSKNREESATHDVKSPSGPQVFVVEKVEGVRLVDLEDERSRFLTPLEDQQDKRAVERQLRCDRAMKAGAQDEQQ